MLTNVLMYYLKLHFHENSSVHVNSKTHLTINSTKLFKHSKVSDLVVVSFTFDNIEQFGYVP